MQVEVAAAAAAAVATADEDAGAQVARARQVVVPELELVVREGEVGCLHGRTLVRWIGLSECSLGCRPVADCWRAAWNRYRGS